VAGQTSASDTPVAGSTTAVVSVAVESLLPQAPRRAIEMPKAIALPIVLLRLLMLLFSPLLL
jgi:hypothetical protein